MKTLLLITAAGWLATCGPVLAESFSFGDYFFAGDTEANGFASVTDQATPYSASGPGAGFTFLSQGAPTPDGWAGSFKDDVLVLYDDGVPGSVTIAFSAPVDSITGLAAEPFDDGSYTATLQAFAGSNLVATGTYDSVNSPVSEGTIPYFDVQAAGITSIVISTTNDADGIGIGSDNAGIPEPASWAMLLVGFAGLGAALRGRRVAVRDAQAAPFRAWMIHTAAGMRTPSGVS